MDRLVTVLGVAFSGANLATNTSSSPSPVSPNIPLPTVPAMIIFCELVTAIPAMLSLNSVPISRVLKVFPLESTTIKIASVAPEFKALPKFPVEDPPTITWPALLISTFPKLSSPELPTCDNH